MLNQSHILISLKINTGNDRIPHLNFVYNKIITAKKKKYKSEKYNFLFLILIAIFFLVFLIFNFNNFKEIINYETSLDTISQTISLDTITSEITKLDTTVFSAFLNTRNELDSIKSEYHSLETSNLKFKLSYIEKNYGIKFITKGDTLLIFAPKIDSALILYDAFKDRLKYNKSQNCWEVVK